MNFRNIHLLGTIWGCLMSIVGFTQTEPFTLAFGSCGKQHHPLPIFQTIADTKPDLFLFLGDNIYGDTRNMKVLKAKYEKLAQNPNYIKLKANVPIIATWDDHDYGQNDAGRHYPFKKESKDIFLNFFDEPADSERREHDGIYTSYRYMTGNKTIQIILLDCRTFRDNLKRFHGFLKKGEKYPYRPDYIPHKDTTKTILGREQWEWLEEKLREPAHWRIIASGTQFGIEYNGYEAWANFPHEQKKMLELIRKTEAESVIFLTGDVHYAEISKLQTENLYPVYDITSSGLSSTWPFATPNKNRIEGPVMDNHFGLLHIYSDSITAEIRDVENQIRIRRTIHANEIRIR